MMTKTEKMKVRAWRIKGESYSEIAEKLNVTFGSVRSYCYRNGMSDAEMKNYSSCIICGKPVEWSGKGLRRMYCSQKCRGIYRRATDTCSKTTYRHVCQNCGKEFETLSNKKQRFCSRACFYNSRRGVVI